MSGGEAPTAGSGCRGGRAGQPGGGGLPPPQHVLTPAGYRPVAEIAVGGTVLGPDGVPLGVVAARNAATAQPILATVGVIQTIPALALLAFLIPLLGSIGRAPALAALFLYSLLPIVRNTHAGMIGVGPGMRQAALALGLAPRDRLLLIELPLAVPAILAGIKTSAVIGVGTATIAAFIGAGGYGERIAQGLALNDNITLLAGAIPAAVLALIIQGAFELLERYALPALRART